MVGVVLLATGCTSDDGPPTTPARSPRATPTLSDATPPTTQSAEASSESVSSSTTSDMKVRVRHRGIDASHHQGAIDWRAVAGDGITFAYLKATEGTSYTDPTFAQHRAEAA